jgi:hypothetical protein
VPAALAGSAWIRSANLSRGYTGATLASFTISQAADVYVGIDNRTSAPSWMSGWTSSGLQIVNSESPGRTFVLYRKNFPAGTVSLGPLNNTGVSMYSVIVK